jgi:hypothetical protein
MAVRQKMKRDALKTKDFGDLDRVRIMIKNKIKEVKRIGWLNCIRDVNQLDASTITKKFAQVVNADSVFMKNIENPND